MIIAKGGDGKGREITFFGLTTENLRRLQKGEPIIIKGDTHPGALPPGHEIMIFHGETEFDIKAKFNSLIGPETKVHIDPKLGN